MNQIRIRPFRIVSFCGYFVGSKIDQKHLRYVFSHWYKKVFKANTIHIIIEFYLSLFLHLGNPLLKPIWNLGQGILPTVSLPARLPAGQAGGQYNGPRGGNAYTQAGSLSNSSCSLQAWNIMILSIFKFISSVCFIQFIVLLQQNKFENERKYAPISIKSFSTSGYFPRRRSPWTTRSSWQPSCPWCRSVRRAPFSPLGNWQPEP